METGCALSLHEMKNLLKLPSGADSQEMSWQGGGGEGRWELGSTVTNSIENFTYAHFLFFPNASVITSAMFLRAGRPTRYCAGEPEHRTSYEKSPIL